ncbi:MAG: type II toxin-antitoxin system YafQ family toxin [Synergistaceae bacterium]|jgi:mRNA interferase YafQ|nr:type II toxin-antitoxin system YafQ family toxin [Synergistaceae bacterium]
MLIPKLTSAYKRDIRQAAARGWDINNKLLPPLDILMNKELLPPQYKDHSLKGEWAGYREFHAEDDWIVIYRVVGEFLVLARTGTHSDLF